MKLHEEGQSSSPADRTAVTVLCDHRAVSSGSASGGPCPHCSRPWRRGRGWGGCRRSALHFWPDGRKPWDFGTFSGLRGLVGDAEAFVYRNWTSGR